MRSVRVLLVGSVLTAGVFGLTGCSQVNDLVGQGVEQVTNGSISLNGLPTDWPGDVPVIDGTVSGGAKLDAGWTALVHTDSAGALSAAQTKLESVGFVVQTDVTSDGTGIVTMINSHYRVTLTGNADGVLYVIAPAQ